jgi:hypothetical protein
MLSNNKRGSNSELLLKLKNVKNVTPERLIQYDGFEDVSLNEADEIIYTLETYCQLILKHVNQIP